MSSGPRTNSGTTGGGTPVTASQFIDGTDIDWTGLFKTIGGGVFLAFIAGSINTVVAVVRELTNALGDATGFVVAVIERVFGIPVSMWTTAWDQAAAFVAGWGLFGYVVALVIVLATGLIIARVVSYVVE